MHFKKTMFELRRRYGWCKFIVVVPSLAIREGVKKSFETMREHFMELYGSKARFFVYDFFVAETKGSMSSLELRGVEKAKIDCARRLFASLSTENVVYDTVDSYASLLNLVGVRG